MIKYTESLVKSLSDLYWSGMSKDQACQRLDVPTGSFSYLMKKFQYKTRPKGFQKGNNCGVRFKSKPKTKIPCLYCDIIIEQCAWEVRQGKKFCSLQCRSRYHATPGEKHWNWQGGISDRWSTLHNSKEYKEWRMSVLKRDWFTCQDCGSGNCRQNPLHAHHIKPKSKYPDLVLDIDNGLTLCRECHHGRHR